MKNVIKFVLSFVLVNVSVSCYDDTEIWNAIKDHEDRIAQLETICQRMNTNISSLQTICDALQSKDHVTNVAPIKNGGYTIGYTITFSKHDSITIYNGEDGKDGKDGKDGTTPEVGVMQDGDGIYYWTLNGTWLIDESGNKIKAVGSDGINGSDGKDGIAPLLKIESGDWYISYDGGIKYSYVGKASGDSANIISVTYDKDYVYIKLSDFNVISFPIEQNELTIEKKVTDLSVDGCANCYIVSEVGTYKFKCVKGNREDLPLSAYSTYPRLDAEVLWESFGTDVSPNVGDLISSVTYSDDYVVFATSASFKKGNAVIAVKNENDEIQWSWHIWFTDCPSTISLAESDGRLYMDRNLGATSTNRDAGAIGLVYQWGRKDPFLSSSNLYEPIEAKSTGIWSKQPICIDVESGLGYGDDLIKFPMTFAGCNEEGSALYDYTLWKTGSNNKTINDPCPNGWGTHNGGDFANSILSGCAKRTDGGFYVGTPFCSPATWFPYNFVMDEERDGVTGTYGDFVLQHPNGSADEAYYWSNSRSDSLGNMYIYDISGRNNGLIYRSIRAMAIRCRKY